MLPLDFHLLNGYYLLSGVIAVQKDWIICSLLKQVSTTGCCAHMVSVLQVPTERVDIPGEQGMHPDKMIRSTAGRTTNRCWLKMTDMRTLSSRNLQLLAQMPDTAAQLQKPLLQWHPHV